MVVAICFAACAALYGVYSYICYSPIKGTPYYFLIGLSASLLANLLWLIVAARTQEPRSVFMLSLLWDVMIVACFVSAPFLYGSVRLSGAGVVGLALVIVGLGLMKIQTY